MQQLNSKVEISVLQSLTEHFYNVRRVEEDDQNSLFRLVLFAYLEQALHMNVADEVLCYVGQMLK